MKTPALLIHDLDYLVTLNASNAILTDAWVLIEDGLIREYGSGNIPEVPRHLPRVNGRGKIATPGLINTHHHFYQTMARAYTPGNNAPLLPWLAKMNALWTTFSQADLYCASRQAIAELMMSGATTTVDHHYIFPKGTDNLIDHQFSAAAEMGVRFHAGRGSMNLSSDLIGDWAVQSTDEIIRDTVRLIEQYHQTGTNSFQQVIVAPCAATSCSEDLLRESAKLAKAYHVGLHTHCGETIAENEFSIQKFKRRPLQYLLDCGWDYHKTWLAHGIHFTDTELTALARHSMGISHCPNANMRLGSGICRVPDALRSGVKVGIGVDGSASNDSGHILGELRQALLLARVLGGAENMAVLTALELGTWRAAELIGRDDIGRIENGFCADLALFPTYDLHSSGCENPVDALILCYGRHVDDLVIGGNVLILNREFTRTDLPECQREHQRRADKFHKRTLSK